MKVIISLLIVWAAIAAPGWAQKTDNDRSNGDAASALDSDEELRRAIQSTGGSETQLMNNLEEYLKKYPKSARREEIETNLYKISVKLHDRNRAITYAEKMTTRPEEGIEALTNLVTMLRERHNPGDLEKALKFADQLVDQYESVVLKSPKPKRISSARWQERKDQGTASVYLLRGKVQADLGHDDKALGDLQKSYKATKLAGTAVSLGDLAERRKNNDEAIDYYIQAFVISLNTSEEISERSIRTKLGQLYAAKHKSEAGLGDRILKAHDAYVKERDEREAKIERPNLNEGVADPFLYTLTKLNGSTFKLNEHQGKVIVINFWATWCGPCLTEMPLFEKTLAKYKNDKDVVFLAITTDEDRELVEPFLKQHKFNLPVAFAEYLDYHFRINSIPTTIVLGRNGQISFQQAGYNPREDFISALSTRIEEAKKK